MNCREARDLLMRNEKRTAAAVASHLAGCDGCAEFGRKLDLAQAAFRAHQGEHLPDPAFAQRVRASLPGDTDLIGWAALRLLPATLALTLVLSAWCWLATPGPQALFEQSPTDDLLSWALEEDGS